MNDLAARAGGDHLLVLDAGVAPLSSDWIDTLLESSQQEQVGAVGGLVLRADAAIDSAGLVLGCAGLYAHAFRGEPHWTRGHLSNILDVRNCSAVSGACLMTRRSVFEQVGGFDERLGAGLWEVDYGLRLRRAGFRTVITPHARICRSGREPSTPEPSPADINYLRTTWGSLLDSDPYYNPHFDRRAATFRLPPHRTRHGALPHLSTARS